MCVAVGLHPDVMHRLIWLPCVLLGVHHPCWTGLGNSGRSPFPVPCGRCGKSPCGPGTPFLHVGAKDIKCLHPRPLVTRASAAATDQQAAGSRGLPSNSGRGARRARGGDAAPCGVWNSGLTPRLRLCCWTAWSRETGYNGPGNMHRRPKRVSAFRKKKSDDCGAQNRIRPEFGSGCPASAQTLPTPARTTICLQLVACSLGPCRTAMCTAFDRPRSVSTAPAGHAGAPVQSQPPGRLLTVSWTLPITRPGWKPRIRPAASPAMPARGQQATRRSPRA